MTDVTPPMDNSELKKKQFTALQEKYQTGQSKRVASDSFLHLILRKAELGIQVTDLEFQWLAENRFFKTVEIIFLQQYQTEEMKRIEADFLRLRTRYHIPKDLELPLSSPVYSILWKVNSGCVLTDSELKLLNDQSLADTTILIQDILNFSRLKVDYKATKNLSHFPEEPLYSILKKLDAREELSNSQADWLLNLDFEETLDIYWQQENERKSELEFLELKFKYQVDHYIDTSIFSPLYSILKKLSLEEELCLREYKWLEQQSLSELVVVAEESKDRKFFAELKDKYKAIQYQNSEPSNHLFSILKNLESFQVFEKDIQWLLEKGLIETAKFAKQIHFKELKTKYQIVGPLARDPFYDIMLKLEREERLDPKQVIQLIEEGRLSRHGKIAIAHYRLEAIFYEKEYKRTGNRWNLASASSNWRKAAQPINALKITENKNWNKVQESDLKSALWVTRGAAFRDLNQLDEAENCAAEAMESQPNSHQPYTLMGAVCYDQGNYPEGDRWFEMATERGADDTDDEIEKIVRMAKDKDKRREVAEYLLNKDPNRYKWARSYLKQE